MPELTPDPVFDKLARFTPDGSPIDPAELLFRAGRASARTPCYWKLTVAGLLAANFVTVGLILSRGENRTPPPPEPQPITVVVPVPVPVPSSDPVPSPVPPESPSPWTLGILHRLTDVSALPAPAAVDLAPADPPLTPRYRGEID